MRIHWTSIHGWEIHTPFLPDQAHPVCMLTSTPTPSKPSKPIKLHQGFNFVTLCLVMTASLVGSSKFSNPLWSEGNEVCPRVQVVSGPISQTCSSSQSVIPDPPPALHRNIDLAICYQNQKNPQRQMECWCLKINHPCLI